MGSELLESINEIRRCRRGGAQGRRRSGPRKREAEGSDKKRNWGRGIMAKLPKRAKRTAIELLSCVSTA